MYPQDWDDLKASVNMLCATTGSFDHNKVGKAVKLVTRFADRYPLDAMPRPVRDFAGNRPQAQLSWLSVQS